jgi:hypothetical protein
MSVYSKEEIEKLLSCAKIIKTPPKAQMVLEKGSYRNDMGLISTDDKLEFDVFMRKNMDFPENFSIGIEYKPRGEKSFCLLRCNGPHGKFKGEPEETESVHFHYHFHKAKPENLERGIRAEQNGEITKGYASFEDALPYFLKTINVEGYESHFPALLQQQINFENSR